MFNLNILDCLLAVHKVLRSLSEGLSGVFADPLLLLIACCVFQALQFGWLDFSKFNVEEYEHYEVSFP